jgi:hypothetical protein
VDRGTVAAALIGIIGDDLVGLTTSTRLSIIAATTR